MGTHPIFESDFDCLTDDDSTAADDIVIGCQCWLSDSAVDTVGEYMCVVRRSAGFGRKAKGEKGVDNELDYDQNDGQLLRCLLLRAKRSSLSLLVLPDFHHRPRLDHDEILLVRRVNAADALLRPGCRSLSGHCGSMLFNPGRVVWSAVQDLSQLALQDQSRLRHFGDAQRVQHFPFHLRALDCRQFADSVAQLSPKASLSNVPERGSQHFSRSHHTRARHLAPQAQSSMKIF